MKKFLTPFKVGLVMLASFTTFFIMYAVVDQGIDDTEGTYRAYAVLKQATGLPVKGQVQMAGIRIGEVEKIELLEREAKVKVTLRLEKRIKLYQGIPPKPGSTEWRDGATLVKKTDSPVVASYYIEVTPGLKGQLIEDGGEIKNVISPVEIGDLMTQFEQIAGDIQKVTGSLAQTFGSPEGQASLQNVLARLDRISEIVTEFLVDNRGDFGEVITNAKEITNSVNSLAQESRQDFRKILADVQAITREVRYIVGQSGTDVQEGIGTLKSTLTRLATTLDTLNYSLQNVAEITDKVNEGEGTLGVLVNDPTIAKETESVIHDVGDFVNKMVELKTIVELRSEYQFRQAALKNYVALRLQPDPSKYYLLEIVDDPRGVTQLKRTYTLSTDANEQSVVREDQVVTSDDFKFSVLFAKRWKFVTGKFGLIESSGGTGVDLHFFEDNLEIKLDAFDFGEDVNPRLRVAFAYTFFQYLYVLGGIDDMLNDNTQDFFFGMALRFDDQDLKTILTTTGAPSP